jgi:hypothetical protein
MSRHSVLARSTTLTHPIGTEVTTPLLVPSFSSKGLGSGPAGAKEVGKLLDVSKEQLTDSMLLSAYDLYYDHLKRPRKAITDVLFVDSGGYETSQYQDLSTTFVPETKARAWSEAKVKEVYDTWPDYIPAVFVSYDQRGAVRHQARRALALLSRYPRHLHAFLVKPKTQRDRFVSVEDIVSSIDLIGQFHLFGVTEKELGNSIIERMDVLSRIRLALDDAGLKRVPIHVFGGLDPITVPLYFLAGAEVFDGLTWLRFGYHGGAALYRQNSAVRNYGVHHSDDQIKLLTLRQNLIQLSELSMQLRRFLTDFDFNKLSPNGGHLQEAYQLLMNKNPRVGPAQKVA